MIVSVCPTFRCNLNCPYCYLGDMVNSSDVLSLDRLTNQLNIISSHEPIDEISLFGGEISLLDEEYLYKLKDICYNFTNTVGVTTNLANINITKIFDNITISLNEERDDYFENVQWLIERLTRIQNRLYYGDDKQVVQRIIDKIQNRMITFKEDWIHEIYQEIYETEKGAIDVNELERRINQIMM